MLKHGKVLIFATFFVFIVLIIGLATPGDSSGSGFNPPNGFVLYNATPKGSDWARAVAIQPDGKIVVVGVSYNGTNYRTLVLRFSNDGTRDNTFGAEGVFTYGDKEKGNHFGSGVALQPDGKIIVVGHSSSGEKREVLVIRCNSNGSLDSTFWKGGVTRVTTSKGGEKESQDLSFGVALQPDGKIVVVGASYNGKNYEAMLLRFNSDGSVDSSFGKGGNVTYTGPSNANVWGRAIAIQPDGKIVMVGVGYTAKKCDVLTMRYNPDGSLDKAFGEGGIALSACPPGGQDFGRSIAIQPDGKIIVAGNTRSGGNINALLLRYNVNGTPDNTFGNGGFAIYKGLANRSDWGRAVALLPDGKIVIAGSSVSGPKCDALVARYNSDGTLDSSFGSGGIIVSNYLPDSNDWGFGAAIQKDGKIVVVGHARSGKNRNVLVMRYKPDGSPDASP